MEKQKVDIADLFVQLASATDKFDDAKRDEDAAERITSKAREEVNRLQKAIDAAMADMKNSATWNTEWHSQRTRKDAVTRVA